MFTSFAREPWRAVTRGVAFVVVGTSAVVGALFRREARV